MMLSWKLSIQGGGLRLYFNRVTEHQTHGLLSTLKVCVTPLWLERVRALTATCSGAPVPGQLTERCQGNTVKMADGRIEKHKEELRCVVISSPIKFVPVSQTRSSKATGLVA